MKDTPHISIRPATPDDAADLAKLIDIAGEGIPSWLWRQSATEDQDPLDVGITRAQRSSGGFSYTNALVAARGERCLGMILGYGIDTAPETPPDDLPAPIVPFVALEAGLVGTWYVNALAVYAEARNAGIGTALLDAGAARAREAGYAELSIEVYAQNSGAARLYRRAGFRCIDRALVLLHPCQPYYTGDVLALTKRLERP